MLTAIIAVAFITGGILYAADHIDTPAVTNQSTDITDLYVFRGSDAANLVFVANSQGLTSPANSTNLKFDENTVLEFNIDNTPIQGNTAGNIMVDARTGKGRRPPCVVIISQ